MYKMMGKIGVFTSTLLILGLPILFVILAFVFTKLSFIFIILAVIFGGISFSIIWALIMFVLDIQNDPSDSILN